MADRADILDTAKQLTCGDRNTSYGPPKENMTDIAQGITWLLRNKLVEPLTASEAAKIQVIVKLSRMRTSPDKMDHYVDLAAYAAIAGECDVE